jgi:hypothetical protein
MARMGALDGSRALLLLRKKSIKKIKIWGQAQKLESHSWLKKSVLSAFYVEIQIF